MPAPNVSQTDVIDGLLPTWWLPGGALDITFSVPTTGSTWPGYAEQGNTFPVAEGYGVLTAQQADAFRGYLAVMDSYVAATFVETDDLTSPGQIRIAFTTATTFSALGFFPGASALSGDLWFGDSYAELDLNGDGLCWLFLHEIGHTLGLRHSDQNPLIPDEYETKRYTVMSNTSLGQELRSLWFSLNETSTALVVTSDVVDNDTLMMFDILALQSIYGADATTGAGHTVYTFDPNNNNLQTIYDAGGVDTWDLSGLFRPSYVDLNEACLSSINYFSLHAQIEAAVADLGEAWRSAIVQTFADSIGDHSRFTFANNVAIAYGTVIENVYLGEGDDSAVGNAASNELRGNGGNDELQGWGGNDTLQGGEGDDILDGGADGDVLNGGAGADAIYGGAGADTISGDGGNDFLRGNGGDDTLSGGAGADDLYGHEGIDAAIFTTSVAGADFTRTSSGAWTVNAGADGADILRFMEYLQFSDRTLALRPAEGTIDGNGASDILLRHTNGALALWLQNGATTTSANIIAATDTSYTVAGSGDFNGDGRFDLLFRNAGGILVQWQLDGASVAATTAYLTDPAWALVAIGDFNGDFKDDILYRHGPTGLLAQWQMDGLSVADVGVFAVSDPAWDLAAVADFNGDGRDDFLWRHSSGALAQWSLDGFAATNLGVFAISDTAWQVAGTGDFNGDLREDIMWRHSSGVMALWHMDGTTVTSVGTFAVSDTAWNVSDIGDYNGDGRDDILWQGPDGSFAMWAMNGFNVLSAGIVGNPGAGWGDI